MLIYSLFRIKCSQDRNTLYKTQKIDTQTKEKEKNLKNLRKHKNTRKHAIHIHTQKL